MKLLYAALAVCGAVLPYALFAPWILRHGLDLRLLFAELFGTAPGAFFAADVIISAVVLIAFILSDGRRRGLRGLWMPILATCLIGVSCGLPLFLLMRERASGKSAS